MVADVLCYLLHVLSEGITQSMLSLRAVQLVHIELVLYPARLLPLLFCNPEGCFAMEHNMVSPAVCASHGPGYQDVVSCHGSL